MADRRVNPERPVVLSKRRSQSSLEDERTLEGMEIPAGRRAGAMRVRVHVCARVSASAGARVCGVCRRWCVWRRRQPGSKAGRWSECWKIRASASSCEQAGRDCPRQECVRSGRPGTREASSGLRDAAHSVAPACCPARDSFPKLLPQFLSCACCTVLKACRSRDSEGARVRGVDVE